MTIHARFDGKVFVPEGPVHLAPGTVVEIPLEPGIEASVSPQGAKTRRFLSALVEIAEQSPTDPDTPKDLAAQVDYYLYGTPKRP